MKNLPNSPPMFALETPELTMTWGLDSTKMEKLQNVIFNFPLDSTPNIPKLNFL